MSSSVDLHVSYRIANAPVRIFPYPHIYVEDVFPEDFYDTLRDHLLPAESMQTLKALGRVGGAYPDSRIVMPITPEHIGRLDERRRMFWDGVRRWLLSGNFGQLIIGKFAQYLTQRLGDLRKVQFSEEALLVQDRTTYSLGPHTDSPSKVMAFLFYLPADERYANLGTSIYVPLDPGFTCEGGPHHDFARFRRMTTMPYVPNALFAFMKTSHSFHGVEPITDAAVRRDLLLYDIRWKPAAPEPAGVKFSF